MHISPQQLTDEGHIALQSIVEAISQQQIHYIDYDHCWLFVFFLLSHVFTEVLWQKGPLICIHLSSSPSKVCTPYYETVAMLIHNCRIESQNYFGKECDEMFISYFSFEIGY